MAIKNIQLPELGEGVTEGELVNWLVKPGDKIVPDQAIAEMMTDKATVEVPSPSAGTVKELKFKEGEVVEVGAVMITIETDGASATATPVAASAAKPAAATPAPAPKSAPPPTAAAPMSAKPSSSQAPPAMSGSSGGSTNEVYPPAAAAKVLATPATRRLAREMSVDINQVRGSGIAGRVTRDDVQHSNGAGATAAGQPSFQAKGVPKPAYHGPAGAVEERVPLKGIRKKIAENMQLYKQIIPHFTLMEEVDVTALVKIREELKVQAEKSGIKVTYLPFVMKALIATLREFPMVNASIDDAAQEIVYKKYFNLGFAADTPQGLLVPVIKDADHKTIAQLSREIVELSTRARAGELKLEEMKGATITITNIGSVGGTYATPIINHPEVAIFGMYKITDKPVIRNGELAVIKSMNFTITADHRLIDGAVAARFMRAFVARIENPGRVDVRHDVRGLKMAAKFDVCVIGAGPGGYVAAIRSAQLGLATCIIEREYMGGVCLNVGCIPSKALISAGHFLHRMQHDAAEMGFTLKGEPLGEKVTIDMKQMQKWKQSVCDRMAGGVEQLLGGNKVTIIRGEANFKTAQELTIKKKDGAAESVTAKNFVIATGSRPIQIPGFEFDEKTVLSSTGGLALADAPKSLVVIGGGYIGLEIGSMLAKFGTQVTVVEAGKALLSGVADIEAVQVVARRLKKNGINVILEAKAKSQKKTAAGVEVTVEVAGKEQVLKADKVLVTVGRRPNSDQLNLKSIGLQVDERGFIKVNAQRKTNLANIYAIGDIAGQPMLAHKASHEGVLVAEVIGGQNRAYDAKTVPAVIFVDPEIASAGWTEEECKTNGHTELKIGKFPFAANGRAVSIMETDGFIKIIADAKTSIVLGVHIVGPEASNLISEAALAIEMGARIEDIALTIHPHPTLGETMMEAAEAALGHAIHIIQKPLTARKDSTSARPGV